MVNTKYNNTIITTKYDTVINRKSNNTAINKKFSNTTERMRSYMIFPNTRENKCACSSENLNKTQNVLTTLEAKDPSLNGILSSTQNKSFLKGRLIRTIRLVKTTSFFIIIFFSS